MIKESPVDVFMSNNVQSGLSELQSISVLPASDFRSPLLSCQASKMRGEGMGRFDVIFKCLLYCTWETKITMHKSIVMETKVCRIGIALHKLVFREQKKSKCTPWIGCRRKEEKSDGRRKCHHSPDILLSLVALSNRNHRVFVCVSKVTWEVLIFIIVTFLTIQRASLAKSHSRQLRTWWWDQKLSRVIMIRRRVLILMISVSILL